MISTSGKLVVRDLGEQQSKADSSPGFSPVRNDKLLALLQRATAWPSALMDDDA